MAQFSLATVAKLNWATVHDLDETALERRLLTAPQRQREFVQPDYGRVHHKLRREGMRHQRFASVHEVNQAITPLMERLNQRPFQKLPGSRASVFAQLD